MGVGSRKPINVNKWVEKWSNGVSSGQSAFEAGVRANTNQNEKAIAAEDKYAAGVQKAIANKSRVGGLQKTSTEDWKRATLEKSSNWSAAGSSETALRHIADSASTWASEIDRIRNEADQKYPNDGFARMVYVAKGMHEAKEARLKA